MVLQKIDQITEQEAEKPLDYSRWNTYFARSRERSKRRKSLRKKTSHLRRQLWINGLESLHTSLKENKIPNGIQIVTDQNIGGEPVIFDLHEHHKDKLLK